jgi:hypothetical protein
VMAPHWHTVGGSSILRWRLGGFPCSSRMGAERGGNGVHLTLVVAHPNGDAPHWPAVDG